MVREIVFVSEASVAFDPSKPSPTPCASCPLRQRPAFEKKPPKEIEWTQKTRMGQIRIAAGVDLFCADDTSAELYTLYSGWAFRYRTLIDGRRQILNFFLPGDLIGFQVSMLTAADHSVAALTDIELCVFPRKRVWRLFQEMPELAFQLSWLGAREEGMVDDNLTAVGQLSAKARMSSMIVGLFKRAQSLGMVEDGAFLFPLRREHLADALGLSLVHTIKTWSALRKAGLFEQIGPRLRVVNPRIDARLAQFFEQANRLRPIL
jgi:CRP-like cAMP-binding protein